MDSTVTQKQGRLIGGLLLIMFIPGIISMNLRGLSSTLKNSPTFLAEVHALALDMKVAILFDTLAGLLGILVAVLVYPQLTQLARAIALGYLSLWLAQFGAITIGNVAHLSLLSLSAAYVSTEGANAVGYVPLGKVLFEAYYWAHFISLFLFSLGASLFYSSLGRLGFIPTWLGLWGVGAVSIVFIATMMQVFNLEVSLYAYLQNGLYLLVLAIWLVIRGFKVPIAG